MNIPIIDIFNRVNFQSLSIILAVGMLLIYFLLTKKIYGLMFILIFSGSLTGFDNTLVADMSSLVRWVILLLILGFGILFNKMKVSLGVILFWGYAYIGFVSVLGGKELIWQIQRSLLLLVVSISIPLAYSDKPKYIYHLTFVAIAIAASIFSLLSFIPLPSQMFFSGRFSAYFSGTATFAMILGALLPFSYWGIWHGTSRSIKFLCFIGAILGLTTLVYSGQRAGTLSGILGLVPLVLFTLKKKYFGWASLFFVVLFFTSAIIFSLSSPEKIDFILNRYSLDSGLSNREWIWQTAFSKIMEHPFWGYGVGASEIMIHSSFHNAYLEIWFNSGLLGLLFYLGAQAYFLYRTWYLLRQPLDLETKSIVVLSLGSIIGFIFVCLFESVGAAASTLNLLIYIFVGTYVSNKELFPKKVMNLGNKILLSRQRVVR